MSYLTGYAKGYSAPAFVPPIVGKATTTSTTAVKVTTTTATVGSVKAWINTTGGTQ